MEQLLEDYNKSQQAGHDKYETKGLSRQQMEAFHVNVKH